MATVTLVPYEHLTLFILVLELFANEGVLATKQDKAKSKYLVKTVETQVETPSHILYHVTVNKTEPKNPKNFRTSLRVVLHDKEDGTNHILLDTAPESEPGRLSGNLPPEGSNMDAYGINEITHQDESGGKGSEDGKQKPVIKSNLEELPSVGGVESGLEAVGRTSSGTTLATPKANLEAETAGTVFTNGMQFTDETTTAHELRTISPNITNMNQLSNQLDQKTDTKKKKNLAMSGRFVLPLGNKSLPLMTTSPTKFLTNLENRVHATTPEYISGSLLKDVDKSSVRSVVDIKPTVSTAAMLSADEGHDITSNPPEVTYLSKLRKESDESNVGLSNKIQERLQKKHGRKRKKPSGQDLPGFGHADQVLETTENDYSAKFDSFSSYPSHVFTTPSSMLSNNTETTVSVSEKVRQGKEVPMTTSKAAMDVGSIQVSQTESPHGNMFQNSSGVYSEDQTSSFPPSTSTPSAHGEVVQTKTTLPNQKLDNDYNNIFSESVATEKTFQNVGKEGPEVATTGGYHATDIYDNNMMENLIETMASTTRGKKRKQKMKKDEETSVTVSSTEGSSTASTQSNHEEHSQEYESTTTKIMADAFILVNVPVVAKAPLSTTTKNIFAQAECSDTVPTFKHNDIIASPTSASITLRNNDSLPTKMSNLKADLHSNVTEANEAPPRAKNETVSTGKDERIPTTHKAKAIRYTNKFQVTTSEPQLSKSVSSTTSISENSQQKDPEEKKEVMKGLPMTTDSSIPRMSATEIPYKTRLSSLLQGGNSSVTSAKSIGEKQRNKMRPTQQPANVTVEDIRQSIITSTQAETSAQLQDPNAEEENVSLQEPSGITDSFLLTVHPVTVHALKSFSTPHGAIYSYVSNSIRTSPIATITEAPTTQPSIKTNKARNGVKMGRVVVGLRPFANNSFGDIKQPINDTQAGTSAQPQDLNVEDAPKSLYTPHRLIYHKTHTSIKTSPIVTITAAPTTEPSAKTNKTRNGVKMGRLVVGLRHFSNNSIGNIKQRINDTQAGTTAQRQDLNTEDAPKSFSTPYRLIYHKTHTSIKTSPIVTITVAPTTEPSAKTNKTRTGIKTGRLVVGLNRKINNKTGYDTGSTTVMPKYTSEIVTEDVYDVRINKTPIHPNVHEKPGKNSTHMRKTFTHPLRTNTSQNPRDVYTTGTENYEDSMLERSGTTTEQYGISQPAPQSHDSKHNVKGSVEQNTEKAQVLEVHSVAKLAVTQSSRLTTISDGSTAKFTTKSSTLPLKTNANFETTTESIEREKLASTVLAISESANDMPVAEKLEGAPSPLTQPTSNRELRSRVPTARLGRIALPNKAQPNDPTRAYAVNTSATLIYGTTVHPKRLEAAKLAVRIRRVESHLNRTAALLENLKKNLVNGRKRQKNSDNPIQNGRGALPKPTKFWRGRAATPSKDGKGKTTKRNKYGKGETAKPSKYGRVAKLNKLESTSAAPKIDVPFENLAKFVAEINPGEDEDEDEDEKAEENDSEAEGGPLQTGNQGPDEVPRQDEGEGDPPEPAENSNKLSSEESTAVKKPTKKTRKKPSPNKVALGRVALAYESIKEEIPPEVLAAQRGKKSCLSLHEFNSIVSLSIKPALDEKLKGVPCPSKLPCQGWGTCTLLWNTGLIKEDLSIDFQWEEEYFNFFLQLIQPDIREDIRDFQMRCYEYYGLKKPFQGKSRRRRRNDDGVKETIGLTNCRARILDIQECLGYGTWRALCRQ